MADKSYILRLEMENGQAVIRGLEDIGAKGEQAGRKIKTAFASEATPGARAFSVATDEAGRAVEGFAQRLGPLGRILTALGPRGLIMAGAIGGFVALGASVRGALNDMDQLADTSQRLKVGVETLQSLRLGARESGFELGQADSSIQSLRDARAKALGGLRGSETAQRAFEALGISEDELEKLDTMEKLLSRVAVGLRGIGEAGQRAGIELALGIDPIGPMLETLIGSIAELNASNVELARIVREDVVKSGAEAHDKFEEMATKLKSAVTPAFVAFGELTLPILQALSEGLAAVLNGVKAIGNALPDMVRDMANATVGAIALQAAVQASLVSAAAATRGAAITESTLTESDRANLRSEKPRDTEIITVTAKRGEYNDLRRMKEAADKTAEAFNKLDQARKHWRDDPSVFGTQRKTMEGVSKRVSQGVQAETDTMYNKFQKQRDAAEDFKAIFVDAFTSAMKTGDVGGALQALADGFSQRLYEKLANALWDLFMNNILGQLLGGLAGGSGFATFGFTGGGGGWADGGYTGPGGRRQVAGKVHKGEYVMNQDAVARWGVGGMDAIAKGQTPAAMFDPSRLSSMAMPSGRMPVVRIETHNHGPAIEQETSVTQDANGDWRIDQVINEKVRAATDGHIRTGKHDRALMERTGLGPRRVKR